MVVDAAGWRLQQQAKMERALSMSTAWHTAALSSYPASGKKLPKLADLLREPRERRRQTPQDQLAVMELWAARINSQQQAGA